MFHVVMSLLSSFRIGVRIKQVVERVIQKTVVTPWPWWFSLRPWHLRSLWFITYSSHRD